MTVAATLRPFFAAGEEIDHTYREAGSSRNIFYVSRDNATLTTAPANFVALSLQFTAAYKVFKLQYGRNPYSRAGQDDGSNRPLEVI